MYAIEARGLTKSFDGTQAVGGIDVLVEEGDIVALLGPNGAGKTTTIMMLLGVTDPDAGSIRILGHPMPAERARALERTGFAASYVGLPYRLRVREFLSVLGDIYGARPGRLEKVCELFGITAFLDRFTTHMSSGQKTLVGLAKSLLSSPRLVVLDEPTASLDPEIAARVRESLRVAQAEEGFALLVTSHNMTDIERLCRRLIFLAHGRVVADGTREEISRRYGTEDLEATFLSIASEARR